MYENSASTWVWTWILLQIQLSPPIEVKCSNHLPELIGMAYIWLLSTINGLSWIFKNNIWKAQTKVNQMGPAACLSVIFFYINKHDNQNPLSTLCLQSLLASLWNSSLVHKQYNAWNVWAFKLKRHLFRNMIRVRKFKCTKQTFDIIWINICFKFLQACEYTLKIYSMRQCFLPFWIENKLITGVERLIEITFTMVDC